MSEKGVATNMIKPLMTFAVIISSFIDQIVTARITSYVSHDDVAFLYPEFQYLAESKAQVVSVNVAIYCTYVAVVLQLVYYEPVSNVA